MGVRRIDIDAFDNKYGKHQLTRGRANAYSNSVTVRVEHPCGSD